MSVVEFDAAAFRTQIPAYADPTNYPTSVIEGYWNQATCFISTQNYGKLVGDCRRSVINYYTAHLMFLNALILDGTTPGLLNASTVGATSISLTPPAVKNQYKWWINLSPYGSAAAALLKARSAGGFSAGLSGPRRGVRQPGGGFI